MLRFISAAFLFLCFAAHTVSAAEMSDVEFGKQIKAIENAQYSFEKIPKGRTLFDRVKGDPKRLRILRETLYPTFQEKIRYVKGDYFSKSAENGIALRKEIDQFYGTEAEPLRTELAKKFKPLLTEAPYYGNKVDVLDDAKKRKTQVAQLENTPDSNELQTIAVERFIPSIREILHEQRFSRFTNQLDTALKIKKEVGGLVAGTSVNAANLHNAVAEGFKPLLTWEIESQLKKAETLKTKGAVFTAMKAGVEQLCQNVTTTVLQDAWAGQIETFLTQQVGIIKWHKKRGEELTELRQLAGKLEGTTPRFLAQLAPDDILAIRDDELDARITEIKRLDKEYEREKAYVLAIEASQAIGNNPGQQNQLRKAVKEIVTKNQSSLKHISDGGYSNGNYVSAFDRKIDSALRIRNVIDTLYQDKEKTDLQDALVTAFKPLVKEGLSFYGSEDFNVRLGKISKLKEQLLPLESESESTTLRLAAVEAFKGSAEKEADRGWKEAFSKHLERVKAALRSAKGLETDLGTTILEDALVQKFGASFKDNYISELEHKNLPDVEVTMMEIKSGVKQLKTEVNEAAAQVLQNAWNEAAKSFFYKKVKDLRDGEKQEQLPGLKTLAERLDADSDQPVFTALFAPSEKYKGDIFKIEEEVFEKKIKETVNSMRLYDTVLRQTSELKYDLEGKKNLQGALLEAFAKGPLEKEVKEIVTEDGDLMSKIKSLYQLKSTMIGMNIDRLAEGTDSTVLQETFANEIKPLLKDHQITFTSPDNVREVMDGESKLLHGIKTLGLGEEYIKIVTRALQPLFAKNIPYGQNKWEYQGKLRDHVLWLLRKDGYLEGFDTKILKDAVAEHYRNFFEKQNIEKGDFAGQSFMRGLAGDLDRMMETQEFETLLQQQQEEKKKATPAAKPTAVKVEEPVSVATVRPVPVATTPPYQAATSASVSASFVKAVEEPVKPVVKEVALKLERHPVHDKTWGTDPFKVLNDIMYKNPDELLKVNWDDPKFQGNPVRAVAMIALSRMSILLDHEFTKDLLNEKIKTLTDVAKKADKTGFLEKYPNKPSQILAMSALLNPPIDDAHTWAFALPKSAEILSTGWLWGFDYQKKTSKQELRALYNTAWNTGIRQFRLSRQDSERTLQGLSEKLIKKPSQEPSGADLDRLVNHQAIAFTIAAKAAAETSANLRREEITDDDIMDTLDGQLTKVWGRTITKEILANKLETLEGRMR